MEAINTILLVEDNHSSLVLLQKVVKKMGYSTLTAGDGVEAMEVLGIEKVDLVLLDIHMPRMNGVEVLKRMKSDPKLKTIPVIIVSSDEEVGLAADCIRAGADDFISKPVNSVFLQARIDSCLEVKELLEKEEMRRDMVNVNNRRLEERIHEQVMHVTAAQQNTIFSMAKLAEARDPESGEHLQRVKMLSVLLANEVKKAPGNEELIDPIWMDNFAAASILHDVGKVGIPDAISLKKGRLTDAEMEIMKTHCVIGANMLQEIHEQHPENEFIKLGIEIAWGHHEKWDGSGYPNGLSEFDIPLSARIVALVDTYDIYTSRTIYREAFTHEKAVELIKEEKGISFDPQLVDAFLESESVFKAIKMNTPDTPKQGNVGY